MLVARIIGYGTSAARVFVTVVEEANFTKAAARVHVAQPGVSAQIRRLERELGQELLDRSGRSVRLTEAGAAVLPYARAALSAVAGARLAVDELTGLVRGRVAVGTVTSHYVDLPGLNYAGVSPSPGGPKAPSAPPPEPWSDEPGGCSTRDDCSLGQLREFRAVTRDSPDDFDRQAEIEVRPRGIRGERGDL
jgi:hypothetical protein